MNEWIARLGQLADSVPEGLDEAQLDEALRLLTKLRVAVLIKSLKQAEFDEAK